MCIICKKFKDTGNSNCSNTPICILFKNFHIVSKVPNSYYNYLLTDLDTHISTFKAYVESFNKHFDSKLRNVYIWSSQTGTGKTSSATALLNEFTIFYVLYCYRNNITPNDTPTYFLDVNELQTLYNSFNRSGVTNDRTRDITSREYYERLDKARNSELIIFDDIGVRTSTDGFRGDIHSLINDRITNGKPSIFTSNHPIARIEKIYDDRLMDRIRDNCVEISFNDIKVSKRGLK